MGLPLLTDGLKISGALASSMSEAFEQAWLVLKKSQQARLPGYEGKMIADDRRKRRRDGRGFYDEPREMGPFLSPGEEVLNKPQNREKQVASRRRPARIVRTFENPYEASNQYGGMVTYALEDEAGERLAEIHNERDNQIADFAGEVPKQHRRKGYYRELIENLVRHGFPLTSHSRNSMSDPFHKKFIRTLPDDIDVKTSRDSDGLSQYDEHRYTNAPYFPGKHGPGGDWGDLRGPHRITVPFFDRSTESHRAKDVEVPSEVPRKGPVRHRNRNIVVPSEASREILARQGDGPMKRKVLQSLQNASHGGRGISTSFANPSFGFGDGPKLIPNPAFGSQLFVQTRLPGLYESDYERNWGGPNFTEPLIPQDSASRYARNSNANYIQ